MFEQIKSWLLNPDTRNFIIEFMALGLIYYISRGVDSTEKFHRIFKSVLAIIFVVVIFAFFYSFSK